MPSWPANLPIAPLLSSYRETPANNLLYRQTEVGPGKVRRRSTANVRPASMAITATGDQLNTLRAFYVTTLAHGALPFDWIDPVTGSAASFRFRPQGDGYRATKVGPDRYQIDLDLEILS